MKDAIPVEKLFAGKLPKFLWSTAARLFNISWFNKFCEIWQTSLPDDPYERLQRGVEQASFDVRYCEGHPSMIPQNGAVVVVANHPFGFADAMTVGASVLETRRDTKVLANSLLNAIEGLGDLLIGVDVFGSADAKAANFRGMRAALKHLKRGGCLVTFPAGEVASARRGKFRIKESQWAENVGELIKRSGAQVVPIYVEGRNSWRFQIAGWIHPLFRTILLLSEFRRKTGHSIELRIGPAFSLNAKKLNAKEGVAVFLRNHVLMLGIGEVDTSKRWLETRDGKRLPPSDQESIVSPIDRKILRDEVEELDEASCLVISGRWRVYLAHGQDIPNCLNEIGRLREETFRSVGEGTGKALDIDDFDQWYHHLFLWDKSEGEIAGAYRIGLSDEIMRSRGISGFYTNSLFAYDEVLLGYMTPALELGRSFVVGKYQRGFASLSLLWKGVGVFLKRNPQYQYLFGPVSISDAYHRISRQLILRFLKDNFWSRELSALVRPRTPVTEEDHPLVFGDSHDLPVESVESVSGAVSCFEYDGKGIPVLIRQYLRFNASVIGFNVDHDFNGAIDGLMLADLSKVSPKLGDRLLGRGVISEVVSHLSDQR